MTAAVLAGAALSASVMGCELIASVDRSIIDGTGGAGGTGGSTATTATVGSTGGAASTTGVGGGTSSSTSTGAPMCVDAAKDCPPTGNECTTPICDGAGICAIKNVSNGTPVSAQTPGDCKLVVCDGAGKTASNDDNTDTSDDGLECTTDTCAAGAPVHTPVALNTPCGAAGGSLKCDAVGACVGCTTIADCGTAAACKVNTCSPAGACGVADAADATPCDDANACTKVDTCKTGVCTGASPVVCSASDQCHDVGTCDKVAGTCSNPMSMNGAACNDANGCTTSDTCQTGVCTGASPVVCAALDQCHTAGTCTPATGTCTNPPATNGTSCNDASMCTTGDVCTAGVCAGAPVVCTPADTCHVAGTCNAATGVCSTPNAANGTACNDANNCTTTDVCTAGSCAGAPVVCSALDQCHTAGSCNAGTGVCSNPPKADNTACNDGNGCTQTDTCQVGVCLGAAPVVCSASDECHTVGTCTPATGTCTNPPASDGTPCLNGTNDAAPPMCMAGVCQ